MLSLRRFSVPAPNSSVRAVSLAPRAATPAQTPLVQALPKGQRVLFYYVDHTIACPVNTGMQRVARGLAKSFIGLGERLQFVKWDSERLQLVLIDRNELVHLARWQGPLLSEDELSAYPATSGANPFVPPHDVEEGHWLIVPEVTHINYHSGPVTQDLLAYAKRTGLRTAFVFFDAIPLRRTEFASMARRHEDYLEQLLLADLVVPISSWSADDLTAFFLLHVGTAPGANPRIAAIPLPGESTLTPRAVDDEMPHDKLALSVGTMESRKNQLTLVRAFESFFHSHPRSGWELALVGNIHPDVSQELEAARSRVASIRVLGNVSDEELCRLYDRCAFTVFPSVEEGFGLPILESLWHGKPCICADFGAMAEVAEGGGCLMVDVRNPRALRAALDRLIDQPAELSRLRREALARRLSTWTDYGTAFSKLLDEEGEAHRSLGTVYYFIEHTCGFPYNTGIQRVVRGLAKALMELGIRLVPVKWNSESRELYAPTHAELVHLARWNGPDPQLWTVTQVPGVFEPADWLLIPEMTAYPRGPDLNAVHAYARSRRVRVSAIFFDAIPWKMSHLYEHAGLHAEYMKGLNLFESVLAISRQSRDDLRGFLRSTKGPVPDLERRVLACPLPGEFPATPRVFHVRGKNNGTIKILCVGSIERRESHAVLLRALRSVTQLTSIHIELWIVGGCHLFPDAECAFRAELASMPNVHWEEFADDDRKHVLYTECDFTVYPSLEEGFGLPILESLWNARPCLCRNSGAMLEMAEDGGCVTVDTASEDELATALLRMVTDENLRARLGREAVERRFPSWQDYARNVTLLLVRERSVRRSVTPPTRASVDALYSTFLNLRQRPLLSVCVSTYNRSQWLKLSLENFFRLVPEASAEIEFLVCDNASEDNTPHVVERYLGRKDFHYFRNARNVGMLGNLRVTAHHARGKYVWILGDDDLVKTGAIERVLAVLREHQDLALVYLNYAYTLEDNPMLVGDLDSFLSSGVPIVEPGPDIAGAVRKIATQSENFFTAIYCLVFRRHHALCAYSQNTEGRPFSTMLTAIPTTHHVLHCMMDEPAYWIGEPLVLVNMNVSWLKYAPLWILERLPEVYDRAQAFGVDPQAVDRWRIHTVPSVVHYFGEIFRDDAVGNSEFFSPTRLVARFKHLEVFRKEVAGLRAIYESARARGAAGTAAAPAEVFAAFQDQ